MCTNDPALRHNRAVKHASRHRWLLLAALVLAACGEAPQGNPDAGSSSPPFAATSMQQAWQGLLACADCDGIDTRLVLDRSSTPARYELQETFLVDGGGEHFREQGQWRRDGRWLRLQADDGGQRVYAIEADGWLSMRDAGRSGTAGAGRLLAPVTPDSPP